MKITTRYSLNSFLIAATFLASAVLPVQAHDQWTPADHSRVKQFSPEQREAQVKRHLEREASMLEIKSSQQSLWESYASAKLSLISSLGVFHKDGVMEDIDAATATRKHAEQATEIAQKLTVLANATEKLQSVLSDDQRKVLNRIAHHQHGFGHHGFTNNGDKPDGKDVGYPAQKPVIAKDKSKSK